MAYPRTRSCNAEFAEGSVDCTYKKAIQDRDGEVEMATWHARQALGRRYGIVEAPVKTLPDTAVIRTPYTVDTPCNPDGIF